MPILDSVGNRLCIQWGENHITASDGSCTFDIPYVNTDYAVSAIQNVNKSTGIYNMIHMYTRDLDRVHIVLKTTSGSNTSGMIVWLAIGFVK